MSFVSFVDDGLFSFLIEAQRLPASSCAPASIVNGSGRPEGVQGIEPESQPDEGETYEVRRGERFAVERHGDQEMH